MAQTRDNVVPLHTDASIEHEDHAAMRAFLDTVTASAQEHGIRAYTVVAMFNPNSHYSCVHSEAKVPGKHFQAATEDMSEEVQSCWAKFALHFVETGELVLV